MQAVRSELIWCPSYDDYFLLWSSNLQLYQVQELSVEETVLPSSTRIRLSEKTVADIVATNNDHQYIKCVSWYHGSKQVDPLRQIIAVGQANGKIALTNFANSSDFQNLIGKEFVPKNSRPVNAIAWNRHYHQYLAAGFDKAGKDHSIYVIDVNKGIPVSSLSHDFRTTSKCEHLQSAYEWSMGETVHSLEFSKEDPQMLLAGINNRQIKLYDFRQARSVNSVSTKAVFGISADPFNTRRFASHVDNMVHIWDVRNFERPVLTLADNGNKPIFKLSWCPTRYGFLSSLSRDSSSIVLYDIQEQGTEREDSEPAVVTRSIPANSGTLISSFSWHPTHENRILISYCTGEMVDESVTERVTLNWSIGNTLVWSNGKKTLHYFDDSISPLVEIADISMLMKNRALKRYGIEVGNLSLNGDVTDDPMLKRLWNWLEQARKLAQDSATFKRLPGGPYRYQGISTLLNGGSLKSDTVYKQWVGVEGSKIAPAKVFISEERTVSLGLCSWGFEQEGALRKYLDYLVSMKQFTRAAAIAVFNLHIPKAIRVLQRGATELGNLTYNTTAMALAGFTSERKALWRETCGALLPSISDPYLRTTFAFLTGDTDSFEPILKEENIPVHDRVAFACKYLCDVRLLEFAQSLKTELMEKGNLDGILLTGLHSIEGLDLLQRYIDFSGDIQTAALLIVHTQPHITTDDRLQIWVDNYLGLLDSLQLWKERVQIDVLRNNGDSSKIPSQIHISCNFCLKSIASSIPAPGKARNPYDRFGTGTANKLKMTACPNPNCRRPLPRCSLCLQYMGTPAKRGSATGRNPPTDDSIIPSGDNNVHANLNLAVAQKNFNNWFTWCHSCRHGGHSQHMVKWFSEHLECPVASCSCKCMSVDAVNSKFGPNNV